MLLDYSISIYLDTRRKKLTGKYPVKLRVFTSNPRTQKLYPTVFEFSKAEFKRIRERNSKEDRQVRDEIQAVEVRAKEVAKELNPFSFEQFERKLYRKPGDGVNVKYQFGEVIREYEMRGQIGSAETYSLSKKSIKEFTELNRAFDKLTFYDITPEWLRDYEHHMTKKKGRSITTVGFYLRALKAVFNRVIEEDEIEHGRYPFGKRKYQIPSGSNTKKALSLKELNKLFRANPETSEQEKAKDFWFFSYGCNGMNIKDIALLRHKDIQNGKIEFIRAKTQNTAKTNQKPISVYLNEFTERIIKKYGTPTQPDTYVFDIFQEDMTPQQQHTEGKKFTRFINQHIKKICQSNGLPEISTYWARHSFATNAIRNGASMEFMQESLGHGNIKTTQNYFAGFDDDSKRAFSQQIMNFDNPNKHE